MHYLKEYGKIVGGDVIEELRQLAEKCKDISVLNINSTAVGGGVAEILHRLIPFLQELGVRARWDVIKGGDDFYKVTKKFHNAIHGKAEEFTEEDYQIFLETNRNNISDLKFDEDVIFVHDPQPVALVAERERLGRKWLWRCHLDASNPHPGVWNFLRKFIEQYDAAVFSAPMFSQDLAISQYMVAPSIDPLSDKNKELPPETIKAVLEKYGIETDRPLISQISRFDYLKDPLGVIDSFELVQKYIDCQLVLAGGEASDDPEGKEVLAKVRERAGKNPSIHVLAIPAGSDIDINALQRASAVVVQKSLKEGFGLTVTEALWKGKPVVASAVGGIGLQVTHKYSGMLVHSIEGAAHAIKQCIQSPSFASHLGQNGHEHVLQNFLLTRHLRDYLLLFLALYHDGDIVNL